MGLGCASVPGTPGGPLQRAGTWQLTGALGADLANSRVTTTTASERRTHLDAGLLMSRIGARFSPLDLVDFAIDYGTNGAGAEVRAGPPEHATAWPFAVVVAARTGALIPLTLQDEVRDQWESRARVEVYPALRPPGASNLTRLHGVLALGASRGRHFHNTPHPGDGVSVLQYEERIEGAVGVEARTNGGFVSLIGLPYYVARSSGTTHVSCGIAHCYQVHPADFVSYEQTLGGTILLTVGVTLGGPAQ